MTTRRRRLALLAAALSLSTPGLALAQAATDDVAAALTFVNDRCQPNVQATTDTLQVRYGDSGPVWRLEIRAFAFDYFAGGVRVTCRDDVAMGRCANGSMATRRAAASGATSSVVARTVRGSWTPCGSSRLRVLNRPSEKVLYSTKYFS